MNMVNLVLRLLLAMSLVCAASVNAQTLRVITEQYPPFNYQENGRPAGLAVEMVQALLKDCGITAELEFQPWNRAYATGLNDANVLLFTLSRRQEREVLFEWLLKVAPRKTWLFRLKERSDIHLTNLHDARAYKIGTGPLEDVDTQELIKAGFVVGQNLVSVQDADWLGLNLQKLVQGHVDLMSANAIAIASTAKNRGVPLNQLTRAMQLSQDDPGNWLVMSKKSDPVLLKKIQASVRKLEKQGVFKAILEKYNR